ncbi:hypothetical protein [Dyadobacter koreensis]|uniref:hypothetical protein n=1 Tax=Dyadobacter koreensis TaxID=408657 RepID=UPI0011604C72|nr:hypothetical protein [Dyadobacter koreensis]
MMKKLISTLICASIFTTFMLSSCSHRMEKNKSKVQATENKVQATENKTEGYLYYQNDHSLKGDSTTVKKTP